MRKDLLSKGLMFLAGGAIGSVVSYFLVRTKYERAIENKNEEIMFLRDRYSKKENSEKNIDEIPADVNIPNESAVQQIRDTVQRLGYINDQVMRERNDAENMNKPYVIPPEETWEQDYPTITLTFYEKDHVLTDEKDRVIENVDELVGDDFASHFGEYEDDCVYVRNDELKVYYEILKDNGAYSEVFIND